MNDTKGNQKHLTLSDRIVIEKGLNNSSSFAEIAREIHKDPTTVSKEVRRHSKVKEFHGYGGVPCQDNESIHTRCMLQHACGDMDCNLTCRMCRKYKCSDICSQYRPQQCSRLKKSPYVCNGCGKRGGCKMDKQIYSSKFADDCYRELLSSSREGINQTPESIQRMNDIIAPLIKNGQSLAHIYATHAEDLSCSRRTMYTYIDGGVFDDVRNIDLRRKVKYKKRKKATETSAKDRSYRKDHNYGNFCKWIEKHPESSIVEMDCVEGTKTSKKALLTMTFRRTNLALLFLLSSQTQEEVRRVFDWLEEQLGKDLFGKLFEVILTDGGSEFADRTGLETSIHGGQRTTIYYCDPYAFWQKGCCEKNHEYIRYVCKKGSSFDDLDQKSIDLLANHINSTKRDSLNGHSPFELSQLLLDEQLFTVMNYKAILPDDVKLTPELLK